MRKYNRNHKTEIVCARVPLILANKINELANETNRSRSDVICSILSSRLLTEYIDTEPYR